MNSKITFKSLLVVIYLLLSYDLHAQVVSKTINIETAGTLSSLIPSTEKYQITSLTVIGNLNGTDIKYIREMAGQDVDGNSTIGKLSVLDLSGANIVTGGSYYYQDYKISLNKIGYGAFYDCVGLTSIAIPNSVTSIGDDAFKDCTGLTSVTIPNSVTSIGDDAFKGCTGLTSVTIPNGVASIGDNAFFGCIGLKEFIVSENNATYSSLEGVLFNKDRTRLIAYLNAKSNIYTIPNSVTSIANYAFKGCTGLTSVTIPNSVTSIGDLSFVDCTGLTSISIPNSVTSISGTFYGCTGLTSVTIPNSVTSIGYYTFLDCRGLTSVTIPKSVTSIGGSAFTGCTGLTEIHCESLTPPSVTSDSFAGITTTCKLYVSEGTYTSYRTTSAWGDFKNIIEEKSTTISQITTSNIKVYTEQYAIVVKGAELGHVISVYTESGALLQSTKATDDIIKINVPANQIYLVKTTGKTFKVAL